MDLFHHDTNMIIIHKKRTSPNKRSLKTLVKEQMTKTGWSNLQYPETSQENSQDAGPDNIWGYLLSHIEEGRSQRRYQTIHLCIFHQDGLSKHVDGESNAHIQPRQGAGDDCINE